MFPNIVERWKSFIKLPKRKIKLSSTDLQTTTTPATLNAVLQTGGDERGKWGSQMEFILACLGYAVGLGNVWRFPYKCAQNGGGAFLIPFFIALAVAGIPLFYLEVLLGQYCSLGPNCLFGKMAPIFQGLGWAMVSVSFMVSIQYNMIIGWVLWYFFASLNSELPWTNCGHHWNTDNCMKMFGSTIAADNLTTTTMLPLSRLEAILQNRSRIVTSPAEEYYKINVLSGGNVIHGELGALQPKLVGCLLGAWTLIFLCLAKGVQSTGKVVYFTATFPYVVLLILLIRGALLDGAIKGVLFYITPDFEKLKDPVVWTTAASQVFYSLGPAFGGLITMASYNDFRNNCFRDALIVGIGDALTSVFAGFAIFSIVGYMATVSGKEVAEIAKQSGPGLAFIAYPAALTTMPLAPLWSVLFFFMLITLGLDSEFAMVETVTTALMDQFPVLRKRKTLVVLFMCVLMFLLGLPMCAKGGIVIFDLVDEFAGSYSILLLSILECVVVVYVYGINRFLLDVEAMLGYKPGWYWRICWALIAPMFLAVLFVYTCLDFNGSEIYPSQWMPVGWLLIAAPLSCLPIMGFYVVFKNLKQFYFYGLSSKKDVKTSVMLCIVFGEVTVLIMMQKNFPLQ